MHSSIFPISNPTSHSKSLPFVTSNFFYKFIQPSSISPSIFLLSMELALSVGSLSAGETSRKRGICTLSSDQIRQDFSLKGRDEMGTGGMRNCAPVQLDLKLSWSTDMGSNYKAKRSSHLDVNKVPPANDRDNEMGPSSSDSRLTMTEMERASSRCSDEEEGGITRKKLRLSKEQSCYLEESFKEHPTLNPKQKLALAKKLNLQPRQVEVWFQNRRARTKLKQTEVDCEYLKRCCESLTEENRRLHRELQDLKALKSSQNSFHMQVPATTLTMCPSCERVTQTPENGSKAGIFGAPKSRLFPFPQRTSAAS